MARGVKRREMLGDKVGYGQWIYMRGLMDELRALGYSWRQLSHLAGKSNRGWATKAYQHRSLVQERDIRLLGKALEAEREKARREAEARQDSHTPPPQKQEQEMSARQDPKAGRGGSRVQLNESEKARVIAQLDRMERAGKSKREQVRLLGYSPSSSGSVLDRIRETGGQVSRRTFRRVQELEQMDALPEAPPEKKPRPRKESAWKSAPEKATGTTTTPAPPAKTPGTTTAEVRTPAPTGWEWMGRVQEKLLEAAVIIDEAAAGVPEAFRGPYHEKRARIEKMIEEFER